PGTDKNLIIIKTDEARFAVAETLAGGKVTNYRFYKTFDEAKAASASAALVNTIYVLNYINTSSPDELNFSQTDISSIGNRYPCY
ncbi:MAG: hypothetical protein Q4F55_05065, partial [Bacillota bacterium]|nr:hypothetical protein [Bacillota bacterium]